MRLFRESRISRASLRKKMLPHECVGIFIEKFHKFVTKEYHDDEQKRRSIGPSARRRLPSALRFRYIC